MNFTKNDRLTNWVYADCLKVLWHLRSKCTSEVLNTDNKKKLLNQSNPIRNKIKQQARK